MNSSADTRSSADARSFVKASARLCVGLMLAASALALNVARAEAQDRGRLRLDSLERLAPRATDTVNVEVDGFLIKLASKILSDKDPDEKTAREIISGLRGVYVRSYEFGKEGEYADSDIAPIREQLRAPAWTRLVGVRSHDGGDDDAEIYVATDAGRVQGLTVLVAEPKEVTVINIVGDIDVEKLKRLEGSLGIPRIHIGHKRNAARRDDDK
ncbi:MAG: DUF4252 domain-containing protein [Acidobacteriota bacterium]|nr:DUF4252 domain-containing protein [Acidobacteriota bacterium]MDQ5837605.1 DUF4252 domain-containing protein [Acidobacteriota bacterium]